LGLYLFVPRGTSRIAGRLDFARIAVEIMRLMAARVGGDGGLSLAVRETVNPFERFCSVHHLHFHADPGAVSRQGQQEKASRP
jgi:hypothetical protein